MVNKSVAPTSLPTISTTNNLSAPTSANSALAAATAAVTSPSSQHASNPFTSPTSTVTVTSNQRQGSQSSSSGYSQQQHQKQSMHNYHQNQPSAASTQQSQSQQITEQSYTHQFSGVQNLHVPSAPQGRRVWVRKPDSTPTTIMVYQDQIVDDLKSLILAKYPNSLGRMYDPADLVIRMDLSPKSLQAKRAVGWNKPGVNTSSSADTLKSPKTPGFATSFQILEPDKPLWSIIDTYFPQGMTMHDSFIIESSIENEAGTSSHSGVQKSTKIQTHPLRQPSPQSPRSAQSTSHIYSNHHKTHLNNQKTTTENTSSNRKDRSISPISVAVNHGDTKSPVSAYHRRSQSIPLNPSYVSSLPSNSSSAPKNSGNQSQAILLLPKNFSLATGNRKSGSEESTEKSQSINQTSGENQMQQIDKTLESKKIEDADEIKDSVSNMTPLKKRNTLPALNTESLASNSSKNAGPISAPAKESEGQTHSSDNLKVDSKSKPPKNSNSKNDQSASINAKNKSAPSKSLIGAKSATDKVLPSISVLVVEDNAINQAILGAFLRKHKIHYSIAKNGQEAVDKWKKGGIHLVIMDLQLPVKSGLEATKEIRYLERINKIGMFAEHESYMKNNKNSLQIKEEEKLDLSIFISPVIIVALTASSNSSVDRKHALMAGCNDYLTKPVNLVWLQNKITEWGCMQALINFDGWKTNRLTKSETSKK